MGRAELHRKFQLALPNVHGDDLGGIHQFGAHDYVQTHPAAAYNRYGAARRDFGAEQDGPDSGGHAAADHRGLVHGDGRRNRHTTGLGHYRVFGEAGNLTHVVDGLVTLMQPGSPVVHEGTGGRMAVAKIGMPFQARLAEAASRYE